MSNHIVTPEKIRAVFSGLTEDELNQSITIDEALSTSACIEGINAVFNTIQQGAVEVSVRDIIEVISRKSRNIDILLHARNIIYAKIYPLFSPKTTLAEMMRDG
jgi:hypothetical protein